MKKLIRRFKTEIRKMRPDYRHIICASITAVSLGIGILVFPNSLTALISSVLDLITAFLYYTVVILELDPSIVSASVTDPLKWRPFDEIWKPLSLLPSSVEEWSGFWRRYFEAFFNIDSVGRFISPIENTLYYVSRIATFIIPLALIVYLKAQGIKDKISFDRKAESSAFVRFKRMERKIVYPVISYIKSFCAFLRANRGYIKTWSLLWLLYFNVFGILVSAVAFYFYFVVSWDILSIYPQLLKLQADLTPMIRFLPGIIWIVLGIWIYDRVCRSLAFQRLYYAERANRAFLRERGVLSVVYGPMGVGKTQMITSMALSAEIEQFDNAFDIMLRKDMMFPNFPWQIFRDELKRQIELRNIVDLPTCESFVRYHRYFFERISRSFTFDEFQAKRKRYKHLRDHTFGYDYTRYATTYNDELKISHLFDALEDYAKAYLIFTVKTSLLFSNYSVRVDSILSDIGNMPVRDNDFFNRPPEYQEAYSHHAHIIDYDMIRLGKRMIEDNPKARRLSFGVYVITEIDKERKNAQGLKEYKMNTDEVNQKNDLFNQCIMMSRHAAVVDNTVFIRFIADLQRPDEWGVGGRGLGEVIYIADKSELAPALPFFSPYWLTEGVFSWIKSKWTSFYVEYIKNRSDGTLFVYLVKNLISRINNHYDKINGLFGIQTLELEMESGTLEDGGKVKHDKWRIITKKDRSRRYKTACLESVFDSYEPNFMHVDDFLEYAGEIGTQEENDLQNSYFQNDIKKMRGMKGG